ncbi:hypothetical protein [Pseudoalteromonas rubra]|uniref:Uncharacterized protein n=1 Tax=Pseudoalteromonas rubra TaxID=43658 RepID=A0A5S3WQ62_9GAMM|nr:hypothetical protein [Pseudoalteromonas rubra]TMP30760.1 hypothetical protein CWB98_23105 [Pseudoalteromonas rubra]
MRKLIVIIILLFPFCSLAQNTSTHTHTPKGGVLPQTGPVIVKSIELLTHESVIGKNLTIKTLSGFIKELEAAVKNSYKSPAQGELLLQIEIKSSERFATTLKYQGNFPSEFLQKIYDNVAQISSINTKKENVKFQIHYVIGV